MVEEKKRLLRARNAKRASFKRQCLQHKKKLKETWRRPRGLQSKQRRQYRAKGRHPSTGYGSPVAIRGYHPSGYEEVLVHTPSELEGLNPSKQAVRIGGTVGGRKRVVIQEKAMEYGLKVLNYKECAVVEEAPVEETPKEEISEEVVEEEDDDE